MQYSEDGTTVTLSAEEMKNNSDNYHQLGARCAELERKNRELQAQLDEALLQDQHQVRNATLESAINARVRSEQDVLRGIERLLREAYVAFDAAARVPGTLLDARLHALRPKTISDARSTIL